jgi:hypothetical protein
MRLAVLVRVQSDHEENAAPVMVFTREETVQNSGDPEESFLRMVGRLKEALAAASESVTDQTRVIAKDFEEQRRRHA